MISDIQLLYLTAIQPPGCNDVNTGWIIKNVPNFAMMLYCFAIEFKPVAVYMLGGVA